jgi:hypothetical protein
MLHLRIVTSVQQAWNDVAPLLASAMVHVDGEYTLDQLKVMLVDGKQTLLVLVDDDNKIQTAFTIEWISYPNDRVAFLTAIGGKTDLNAFNQFKDWVKASGGTKIQGATFESVARLWKMKLGFKHKYTIMEYAL